MNVGCMILTRQLGAFPGEGDSLSKGRKMGMFRESII